METREIKRCFIYVSQDVEALKYFQDDDRNTYEFQSHVKFWFGSKNGSSKNG